MKGTEIFGRCLRLILKFLDAATIRLPQITRAHYSRSTERRATQPNAKNRESTVNFLSTTHAAQPPLRLFTVHPGHYDHFLLFYGYCLFGIHLPHFSLLAQQVYILLLPELKLFLPA